MAPRSVTDVSATTKGNPCGVGTSRNLIRLRSGRQHPSWLVPGRRPRSTSPGAGADSSHVNLWFTHRTWFQEETEAGGRLQLSDSPTQAGFRKVKKSRAAEGVGKAAQVAQEARGCLWWITAPLPCLLQACKGSD
uniref:Uncharacterized protein n=1 Tax=Molossus molossus TaxID=27622 RepID=A0A7J8JXH7_MOLMO|nr:hypothetical protein HJG59_008060 [Molossus molossus]